jgi:arylsulfatase A-like enzyme
MTNSSKPPDILVVVMDCGRFQDFPGGTDPVAPMPFTDELRKQSVAFPRAVSPCSWTIPSHAGLFTGLYPWESGVHAKADLRLDPTIPRLAERLANRGYRSIALSANPLLLPTFGLMQGFDRAYWSAWWEPFLRSAKASPGFEFDARAPPAPIDADSGRGGLRRLLLQLSPNLFRAPFLMDSASRLVQKMEDSQAPRSLSSAPWIERCLDGWVRERSRDESVFAFVNLLEAHEPYFTDSEMTPTFLDWLRYARCRQDHFSCAAGRWTPSTEDLARLRQMYRHMLTVIDRRLKGIVDVLKAAGRWDNTLMVLTSDHGQAFGEHGIIFHALRVDEAEVRIPLWVRYPDGSFAGATGQGWASLIDVPGTIMHATGANGWQPPSAVSLESLVDAPRPIPVMSMSDGLTWTHVGGLLTTERKDWLDRVMVAAYNADQKVVVNAKTGEYGAYNVAVDPLELRSIDSTENNGLGPLVEVAREAGRTILRAPNPVRSREVEERLAGWGYL